MKYSSWPLVSFSIDFQLLRPSVKFCQEWNTSYNEYYSRTWKGKERKDEKPPSKDHPPRANSSRTSHESAKSSQGSRTSSIKCFKCLGYGRIASNCPTKRNMILNPKGEVESEHSSPPSPKRSSSHTSSQSSSEDEIKLSEGGLLVVRRMLGQVPKEFENQKRKYFSLKVPNQQQNLLPHN